MPTAPVATRQTTKQAKAAFKARGSVHVSSAERRKLERGAQLLERADRLKAQERRKKEWVKKREGQDAQQKTEEDSKILGSQLRLDKFGYKSSQFHLGRFFGPPKAQPHAQLQAPNLSTVKEEYDDENMEDFENDDLDEATMLGLDPINRHSHRPDQAANDWTDFLESSTQIARELSDETPKQPVISNTAKQQSTRSRSLVSIPSWNSDEAFDEEDLAALEDQLAAVNRQHQMDKDKLLMPPPPRSTAPSDRPIAGMLLPPKESGSGMQPPPRPRTIGMPPPPKPSTSAISPPPKPSTIAKPTRPTTSIPEVPRRPRGNISAPTQIPTSSTTMKPLPAPTDFRDHKTDLVPTRRDSTSSLARYGISAADLECLAADDVVLSQWPGG